MPPIPVTIITGFLGSGKTTLILNLIPQLPETYKLALLKNEFGDLAVDSQLASSASISGVQELLNGCICCNLVGQLSDALFTLRNTVTPDRIIIETSGSAFPATLAMEVNRVARENPGTFNLDGVVSVIDVENWKGYDDTSITAKMQAKYTDLIVFNKWELVDDMAFEKALDRVGDLEVQIAWVKSKKGLVDVDVVIGIDGAMIGKDGVEEAISTQTHQVEEHDESEHHHHHDGHGPGIRHVKTHHQDEVEVLSVVLRSEGSGDGRGEVQSISFDDFEDLLLSAPKDEIYRIKGLLASARPLSDSTGERKQSLTRGVAVYVLNWAFGRWTYTPLTSNVQDTAQTKPDDSNIDLTKAQGVSDSITSVMRGASARLTFILARGEATKWKKRLEQAQLIRLDGHGGKGKLTVEKIS